MKRFSLFLAFLLIISQLLMFTAKQAYANMDDEKTLWTVPETFIIKTPKGYYLTREDMAQKLDYLRGLGFNVNRNFVWYSYQTTIRVGDYASREWCYFRNGTTFDWIALGGRYGLFEDHVDLSVFKYGDTFISRVCGNFSKNETYNSPPPPKISGYKWEDKDGDGKWDSNEKPLSGWKIKLIKNGKILGTDHTDANGYYEFKIDAEKGLTPGVYTISEELPSGWIRTHSPGPVKVEAGKPGLNYRNNNFGNFKLGKISGYKWDDKDEDGEWDNGEKPIEGWKIILRKSDGSTEEAYTDENGYYKFSGLRSGDYNVSEGIPEGWVQTCPKIPKNKVSYDITVRSGTDARNNNFGNFKLGKISGYKWDDKLPDHNWSENEVPLPGWTIVLTKLTEDGEEVISETKTDENGFYSFEGLHHGTYRVWEVLEDSWRQSTPEKNEDREPPNPSWGEGCYEVVVESGAEIAEQNFGNVKLGSIEKKVLHFWWLEPIGGICVRLEELDVPGVLENIPPLPREGYTDENGSVLFDSLLPGKYLVSIELPEPWSPQPPEYKHEVDVPEGEDVLEKNFIYDNQSAEPRTIGFWKNWRNKYTDADMEALIQRVRTGSQDFAGLSLDTIDAMLNTSGKKDKKRMATIQYLATWLNLASERLGFLPYIDLNRVDSWDRIINDDDGVLTVHELMLQMRELYNSSTLTDEEWEIFKNICDELNNSNLFF